MALRESAGALPGEQLQQIKGFGREVPLFRATPELAGVGVEGERAKRDTHAQTCDKPGSSL
jgi:hypothetical protein